MLASASLPLRVAVAGGRGRTGSAIVAALEADPDFDCAAVFELGDDLRGGLRATGATVLVDFTAPGAGLANALAATECAVAPVVGTTGLGSEGVEQIREACAGAGVGGCVAANFALGAALLMWLSALAAPHFDFAEIVEAHHPGKADAPSGTALKTAARMLGARRGAPFVHTDPSLETLPGTRGGQMGGIGLHSLRLDGAVADQEVVLGAHGQTLTLAHRTTSRAAFAPGVLLACRAVTAGRRFYASLEEVLGLPDPLEVVAAGSRGQSS